MSQPSDTYRKRMTVLLFGILGLIVFFAAFGPTYISGENDKALFEMGCNNARYNVAQLRATQVTLTAQSRIAHDLGLPVAADIDEALKAFVIPSVPVECEGS